MRGSRRQGFRTRRLKSSRRLLPSIKKVAHKFHSGAILPIGDEPDGRAWTGFQSISSADSGFVIVYREMNKSTAGKLKTYFDAGAKVKFEPVLGDAKAFDTTVDVDGRVEFSLPRENSFGMWRYRVAK